MFFCSKNQDKLLIGAVVFIMFLVFTRESWAPPPPPPSPVFSLTKHGNTSAGVDRYAVTGSAYPDTGAYPKGHCGHCHEAHASIGGGEPSPTGDTENPYNLFKENYGATNKNELCFACHETFNFAGGTPDPPLGFGRYYFYSGKTDYNNSTHKTSANMKWPASPPPGPTYPSGDAGNCHNCHNPHGYKDATGVIPSQLFKREDALCTECHDGSPASGTKDVKTRVTTDTYRHNVGGYSGKHAVGNQETSAYISTSGNKHVECVDCHNPHMSMGTLHTASANYKTASGNLTSNSGMLTGVLGAITTFSASNWTVPTSYSLGVATKEYEICFKCHASYNTDVANWGGSGAAAWTNLGLEFSTSNQSYHPVAGALPATDPGVNGSSRLAAALLINGWAPGDTMYCSDCHNTNASNPQGPHGSSIKWMLSGTNKAWPYTTASGSTYRYLPGKETNLGTDNGLFCRNCHPVESNSNKAHKEHDNAGRDPACVECHIRVPHGGKVSRLMIATGSDTWPGNLPARYAPDGNGGRPAGSTVVVSKFTKASSYTGYDKANCRATGTAAGGGDNCNTHNTSSGETW